MPSPTSKTKYCSKCGTKLIQSFVSADDVFITHGFGMDEISYIVGSAFNPDTGEPQFCRHYECPKKRWFNRHDSYTDETII